MDGLRGCDALRNEGMDWGRQTNVCGNLYFSDMRLSLIRVCGKTGRCQYTHLRRVENSLFQKLRLALSFGLFLF